MTFSPGRVGLQFGVIEPDVRQLQAAPGLEMGFVIGGLGLVIGLIEGWSVQESIYFAFVSGLTIGYGDFAPHSLTPRVLAVVIGLCGVLLTALVAAVAVKALSGLREDAEGKDDV